MRRTKAEANPLLWEVLRKEVDDCTDFMKGDKISAPELDMLKKMRKDRIDQYIAERHSYAINVTGRGLYITRDPKDPKKKITCKTMDGLKEKLFEIYGGKEDEQESDSLTLEQLFDEFEDWAKKTRYKELKTIKEKEGHWARYFRPTKLADMDIRTVTIKDIMAVYSDITAGGCRTRKYFTDIQGALRDVYRYAISVKGLDIMNLPQMVDFSMLSFRPDGSATDEIAAKPLTKEQRKRLIEYCRQDLSNLQYLMILFNLNLGLRYAELAALRWCDVSLEKHELYVRGQINSQHERVNYTKKRTKEGLRDIPLTEEAEKIFKLIKMLRGYQHGEKDLIFPSDGYRTFLRRCKEAYAFACGCESEHLEEHYVTHTLRATAASVLYNEGMQPKLIQRILGHKSLSMTMRYCHDFTSVDEVRNCMQKAFSNQRGFA